MFGSISRRAAIAAVATLVTFSPSAHAFSSAGGGTSNEVQVANLSNRTATQTTPADAPSFKAPQAQTIAQNNTTATGCVEVGFSAGWEWAFDDRSTVDRTMDTVNSTKAGHVRFAIDWNLVESVQGQYDWSRTDKLIDSATSRGLNVLGIITYTPEWARATDGPSNNSHTRPANPALFGEFAAKAAERYGDRVTDWEIWNEPNLQSFFLPRPDTAQYMELLKASYTAIKEVQPGANVISGGLSPAVDGINIAPTTFLDEMYSMGGRNYFDNVGIHPYSFPAMPDEPNSEAWNTFIRMGNMYDTMVANGDSNKKLWMTEVGAPTGTAGTAVSPARQGALIARGIELSASLPYAGPYIMYTLRDYGTNPSNIEHNFGIFDRNWNPKAGYAAIKRAIDTYGC